MSKSDKPGVSTSGAEVTNISGHGFWLLVDGSEVNNLKAAYSYISGVRAGLNTTINNPLLLLNGIGGPYASGVYANYGEFRLNGGHLGELHQRILTAPDRFSHCGICSPGRTCPRRFPVNAVPGQQARLRWEDQSAWFQLEKTGLHLPRPEEKN